MTGSQDRLAERLRPFFEQYSTLYFTGEATAVANLCAIPFVAVRNGVALSFLDFDHVRGHFESLMEVYRTARAAGADLVSLDVLELGERSLFVTIDWHALADDGSPLLDFVTSYHLLSDGDSWRILSYTNHD